MNKTPNQPLRFRPLLRNYIWGGQRLSTQMQKSPGSKEPLAESWEIVDLGEHQSRLIGSPWAGMTLHELVTEHGESLLGVDSPQQSFPLLFKYLDCRLNLSIQVHPNDQRAARLDPPGRGKTEAWVVLEAEAKSRIYAGLKQGVGREEFIASLQQGNIDSTLHWFEPEAGDCILVPAGCVHALGAGLLVAEIQQSSDTTYRLFDWNRLGSDGQPRPLHLEAGLEAIDFEAGPVMPQIPIATDSPQREILVNCPSFVLDRFTLQRPETIGGDGHCRILSVLAGEVEVGGEQPLKLARGETCLVPAAAGAQTVVPASKSIVLSARQP